MNYKINKLKKKDYVETVKLIKEIKNNGFIQRNINKFLKGDIEFTDVIADSIVDFAEILGEESIQKKIDSLLEKTIEGIDLDELDLDAYLELLLEWVEVQNIMGFLKKLFPNLEAEMQNLMG